MGALKTSRASFSPYWNEIPFERTLGKIGLGMRMEQTGTYEAVPFKYNAVLTWLSSSLDKEARGSPRQR